MTENHWLGTTGYVSLYQSVVPKLGGANLNIYNVYCSDKLI